MSDLVRDGGSDIVWWWPGLRWCGWRTLRAMGLLTFGRVPRGAQLEGSRAFRQFSQHGIPDGEV